MIECSRVDFLVLLGFMSLIICLVVIEFVIFDSIFVMWWFEWYLIVRFDSVRLVMLFLFFGISG